MKDLVVSLLMSHQNPVNLLLHMIGIPLVLLGIFQLFIKKWKAALISIFIGYLIQYLGHLFFEHNQMSEWVLIMNLIEKLKG